MFLGIERGVVVQSAAHGYDHWPRPISSPVRQLRRRRLRRETRTWRTWKKLHGQGFRVRFNFVQHLGSAPALSDEKLATKLAVLGWHLQLYVEPSMIVKMTPEPACRCCRSTTWARSTPRTGSTSRDSRTS